MYWGIELNWLAICIATLVSVILAGLWYQDFAFGVLWKKLTKIDTKRAERAGNTPMAVIVLVNFITAIFLAFCIDLVAVHFNGQSVLLALTTSLGIWGVFSALTLMTHNMFEQKSWKLTLINCGYQLAMFLAMALIIGSM